MAYDLKYTNTQANDYKITDEELLGIVDSVHYLGKAAIATEAQAMVQNQVISESQANLVFGEGYGMKRNAVLYFALKYKMDQLIFLDDDEYPIANLMVEGRLVWEGQQVLATHVRYLENTDMTNGFHCGYISPIPKIDFNDQFTEEDFHIFIEAISNDIVNWDSVKQKMADGGITYAQPGSFADAPVIEVEEQNGMKFISGANLGINLRSMDRIFPFYNPPGARGEDTFLSTCIGKCHVVKIPCYTFHDGYSAYAQLLTGTLPNALKMMKSSVAANNKRFLKASIGWIRYKPLLVLMTQEDQYPVIMARIKAQLESVIPKLCRYYANEEFYAVRDEFNYYCKHVEEHRKDFMDTKAAWLTITAYLTKSEMLSEGKVK